MIVGHERQIRYLERVLAHDTLAHAYLLYGPEGVGKRTVALAVAQALLCSGDRALLGGCGTCEDCGLLRRSAHPDLIAISVAEPLVSGLPGQGLGIKTVHELRRRLALSSWRGGRKVVVVDGAEDFSRDAQSALLGMLEEPDAVSVFFLVTSRADALLPTIRSRSVPIGFAPLEDAAVIPLLATMPPARQRLVAALASGRPGVAVRLVTDAEFFKTFRGAEEEYAGALTADLSDQLAFSERVSRDAVSTVSFLERLLRHARSGFLTAIDAKAALASVGTRAEITRAILSSLSLAEATAVNRRLLLDALFVGFATRP